MTVKLTVTVEVSSTWGETCTVGQVKKQAREEALHFAMRALQNDPRIKAINAGEVTLSAVI